MKKLIIFLTALLITATAFSQAPPLLKNEHKKGWKPDNTLLREYHFEISLLTTKTVIFTDMVQPLPPPFEVHNIEFIGSKVVIEVGVNMTTQGTGPGTGKIVLNSDIVFGELNFETIPTSALDQLIICMIARPVVIQPTGANALSLDFTKGTLGGLNVQVKIKMYK